MSMNGSGHTGSGLKLAAAGVLLAALALPSGAGDWKGSLGAGSGVWSGDATYSIGGTVWEPGVGSYSIPDKISELKFPLDVYYGSVEGSLTWKDRLEAHALVMGNLNDPGSDVEDSDWDTNPYTGWRELIVYSRSEAELSAWSVDAGARCWIINQTVLQDWTLSAGVGLNLLYQHLDWTAGHLDQWYPAFPWRDHILYEGDVITYANDILMPYLDASAAIRGKWFSGRLDLGAGPAFVDDEDDHLLRYIRATSSMTGFGLKGTAELRCDFTEHLFALVRASMLAIEVDGTEKDFTYGGEDYGASWEIDHTYTLNQFSAGVSAGCAF